VKKSKQPTGFIKIGPQEVVIPFTDEKNLLQLLVKNGISIDHSCGGGASCGTCRVLIKSDINGLPARETLEKEMALDRGFVDQERLSCQLSLFDGLQINIPKKTVQKERKR